MPVCVLRRASLSTVRPGEGAIPWRCRNCLASGHAFSCTRRSCSSAKTTPTGCMVARCRRRAEAEGRTNAPQRHCRGYVARARSRVLQNSPDRVHALIGRFAQVVQCIVTQAQDLQLPSSSYVRDAHKRLKGDVSSGRQAYSFTPPYAACVRSLTPTRHASCKRDWVCNNVPVDTTAAGCSCACRWTCALV